MPQQQPKILKFRATSGFGRWQKCFPEEAVAHPAKINLHLLEYLIQNYTEEGDTLLDPMAGTGSTGIVGGITSLPSLISFDICVFSPPYSLGHDSGDNASEEYGARLEDQRRHTRAYLSGNIAKLPFIAAILFSAPYFSTRAFQDFDFMLNTAGDASRRIEDGTIKGHGFTPEARRRVFEKQKQGEIEDAENIGNINDFGVDAVLTSPPYEESLGAKHHSPRGDILAAEKGNPSTYTQIDESVSRLRGHGRSDDKAGDAFGKSLGHPYSSSEENIGNQKKESYLEAMKTVYAECHKVLKPHGLLIFILKNFIRDKKVVPLTDHTIKLCEGVGFKLKERLLFKLPTQSFWRRLYSQKYPEVDTADLQFEHILVFEKKEGF